MTRAETLFLACCDVLAHHRGSFRDPVIQSTVDVLAEVLPEIPKPGPGPEIGDQSLRVIAECAVAGGVTALPATQHFLRLLLQHDAIGRVRQAYDAWSDELVAQSTDTAA